MDYALNMGGACLALVQRRTEQAAALAAMTLGLIASRALSAVNGALIYTPPQIFAPV